MVLTTFIYLLCIGCWIGAIAFFSFFTAPVLFSRLSAADAGKVVTGIFPSYYTFGYGCGFIAFVVAFYFALYRAPRLWWALSAVLILLALGCSAYAGAVIRPRVAAVHEVVHEANPDPVRKAKFDSLHRLSVILNGGTLLLNLIALACTAAALGGYVQN